MTRLRFSTRVPILLTALVVVQGFCREAGAVPTANRNKDDYSIWWGMQRFGFHDGVSTKSDGSIVRWSFVNLGPLGSYQVPFTAIQGLIGFCLILALLIIVPAVLAVRWERKRAAR